MAVKLGSARSSYGNTAKGDQNGKEVSTQDWYRHSKGWVVLRPKDSAKAELIAQAMEAACKNDLIGYDQATRGTLYDAVKDKDFDPSRCTVKCNTDCSALVRVCVCHAGIKVKNFTTADEVSVLVATGEFTKLTDSKYTASSAYLQRGDILDTCTKGHTVVVLSNGSKVTATGNVVITGGKCYVRNKPNTSSLVLGVVHEGDTLAYAGEVTSDGWIKVSYGNKTGYVSGKFGRKV